MGVKRRTPARLRTRRTSRAHEQRVADALRRIADMIEHGDVDGIKLHVTAPCNVLDVPPYMLPVSPLVEVALSFVAKDVTRVLLP